MRKTGSESVMRMRHTVTLAATAPRPARKIEVQRRRRRRRLRCRSAARRTCPRAGPTAATAAAAATSCCVCDDSLRDLQSFRRRAHFRAERGGHGEGSQRHGADGDDARRSASRPARRSTRWDGTRYDLVAPGPARSRSRAAAPAGAATSASRRRRGRRRASPSAGSPGEEGWIELHLKLLADVGLVGLPNAGKSSLLARLTRAQPKVADYPFTTLEPVLGTLEADDRQLVIADIPGLIEGASDGAGLGHDFLAHVERTRLLVHVLDLAPLDGSDPVANHATIERELAEHDAAARRAAARPRAVQGRPRDAGGGRRPRRERVARAARRGRAGAHHLQRDRRGPRRARARAAAPRAGRRAGAGASAARGRGWPSTASSARPAARAFEVERVGDGRVPRHRRGGRAPDRAPRPRERGGAGARRAPSAPDGRDRARWRRAGFEPGDDVEIAGVVFELDPGAPL